MSEEISRPAGSAAADIRASDEDRERLAVELRDHAVAGRLDTDELEERLQAAYAARTTGELAELRRDLPATPDQLALAHRERRSQLVRRCVQEAGGGSSAFAICLVIWIASGATGFFWPIFVLLGTIGLVARTGWDLYGPAADLDAAEARLDAHNSEKRRGRHADGEQRRLDRHAEHRARRADRRDRG